jgi:hypothetical protein
MQNPADNDVKLSTAPDPTGATHWGQQVFYVNPPIDCAPNDALAATMTLTRKKENHRLLKVELKVKVGGWAKPTAGGACACNNVATTSCLVAAPVTSKPVH